MLGLVAVGSRTDRWAVGWHPTPRSQNAHALFLGAHASLGARSAVSPGQAEQPLSLQGAGQNWLWLARLGLPVGRRQVCNSLQSAAPRRGRELGFSRLFHLQFHPTCPRGLRSVCGIHHRQEGRGEGHRGEEMREGGPSRGDAGGREDRAGTRTTEARSPQT